MPYNQYNLRISDDARKALDSCKGDYGAELGLNRFIEAIGQFCLTGSAEVNGIKIREFFDDALAGRLHTADSRRSKLKAAEEQEYTTYSLFMKSTIGKQVLQIMCEKDSAEEFFASFPKWINVLREEFLLSDNGFALRISTLKRYTERWYQERIADGSAAEYLKQNILTQR